jgi:hypothetical protein
MHCREWTAGQLRQGNCAGTKGVAWPAWSVRCDGNIVTTLDEIDEFAHGPRSPARTRPTNGRHTEMSHDLREDLAITARAGQHADSLASVMWIPPEEGEGDSENSVVPKANDDRFFDPILRKLGRIFESKADGGEQQPQDHRSKNCQKPFAVHVDLLGC